MYVEQLLEGSYEVCSTKQNPTLRFFSRPSRTTTAEDSFGVHGYFLQNASTFKANALLIVFTRGCQVLMAVTRKELEPGLHISRRSVDDFHRFLRVTRFFTSFVRLREARPAAPLNLQPHADTRNPRAWCHHTAIAQ